MKKIIYLVMLMSLYSPFNVWGTNVLDLVIDEYPPYVFTDPDTGTIDGISIRVVNAVFKHMNQSISLRVVPWSRSLKLIREGKIDGIIQIFKNEERQTYLDFNNVVLMNEVTSLFVVEDSDIHFEGELAKLNKYHFGARQDFSYGTIFDQAVTDNVISNISLYVEHERLVLELCTGELDIAIGESNVLAYREHLVKSVKKNSVTRCKKIKELSPPVQLTPGYIAFSKKRELTDIRDKFDAILMKMKQDGSYQEIIDIWGKTH
ncbi:transporter substrate-binding domain-containing protein [Shewanella sp. VB17]|uniref:substrate-binding periplasmic protein n=1 Tax=Shewanella sp. VB17 TaxID=2739432 RepID=UPI001566D029|nr:transporter substrate-binding domain-containing protein [Shewanella sp. VB17]NRD73189.1 transporter substrate-binding domain-containing protein [Shewanella sp. VB17]